MKTRLLTIAILLCTFAAKAQYVTIPDANFVSWLTNNGYGQCMNGNLLDTTCNKVVADTLMECGNAGITSVEGIQYFDNLRTLACGNNHIIAISAFPPLITKLVVGNNELTSLPALPQNITELNVQFNYLPSLPELPSSLKVLYCNRNYLTSIPSLPLPLQHLECDNNQLTSLPQLPSALQVLHCQANNLTALPTIPQSLKILNYSNNPIPNFVTVPASLESYTADNTGLSSLQSLPPQLQTLSVEFNNISQLPNLPSGLETLKCDNNQLSSLPTLPLGLRYLECSYNHIAELPQLPNTIIWFGCAGNGLDSLPELPLSLNIFNCIENNLTQLPPLPPQLQSLSCQYNQLTSLPALPASLTMLFINNNPNLKCLPPFSNLHQLEFENTGITCLPNYAYVYSSHPPLSSLPLCGMSNLNDCEINWNLGGNTYLDNNANCILNQQEPYIYNIPIKLLIGDSILQHIVTGPMGFFGFDVNAYNVYTIEIDTTNIPFKSNCNVLFVDTINQGDSITENLHFGVECKPGIDLSARSIATPTAFRPTFKTQVDFWAGELSTFYGANCATGIGGTVQLEINGAAKFISMLPTTVLPSYVSDKIVRWNVADLGSLSTTSFSMMVQTDTLAQLGNEICFEGFITSSTTDRDTTNNILTQCFIIVNSYDPNDKTAYPSGNIDTTQEWLTYRVRFQNTGTAEAQHIYIMDTLDNNVQVETFQLLSYSHQPIVQIKENIVRFNFPYINLPDSNTNEPGSHGYVQYKVKLKEDLPVGTAINNTAYIYFDFNPPVVTNTATNTIAVEEDTVEVGIKGIQRDLGIMLYPNPANNQITVSGSAPLYSITIYDIVGRIRLAQNVSGTSATIDISNLPSGLYVVGTGSSNKRLRLVKQ